MYTLILVLHIIIVVSLIGIILIQRGRSGGLVEALGGVESILGTKTNAIFVKITVALAIGFFATSVSLAYMSKNRSRSIMEKYGDKIDNATAVKIPGANSTASIAVKPAVQTGAVSVAPSPVSAVAKDKPAAPVTNTTKK
jgi:preprotein translocase subunit SecG